MTAGVESSSARVFNPPRNFCQRIDKELVLVVAVALTAIATATLAILNLTGTLKWGVYSTAILGVASTASTVAFILWAIHESRQQIPREIRKIFADYGYPLHECLEVSQQEIFALRYVEGHHDRWGFPEGKLPEKFKQNPILKYHVPRAPNGKTNLDGVMICVTDSAMPGYVGFRYFVPKNDAIFNSRGLKQWLTGGEFLAEKIYNFTPRVKSS